MASNNTPQSRYLHWAASKGLLKPSISKPMNQAGKGFNLPSPSPLVGFPPPKPMVKPKTVSFNSNMKNYLSKNPKLY